MTALRRIGLASETHRYVVGGCALVLVVLLLASCNGRSDRAEKDRASVAEMVKNGGLAPENEESHRIVLPAKFKSVSVDGSVYVTRTKGGNLLIVFPTWLGKPQNMRGYLYADAPLAPADKSTDYYGDTVVLLFLPDHPDPERRRNHPVDTVLLKQLNVHWYKLSRSLD